ncbi:MAG: hypothetical protein HY255_12730 [Betaproteobacteria bacterium]|nr:hypothetical protein [Betaproteobacteria bacterium]
MKTNKILTLTAAMMMTLSMAAHADDNDCFPMCTAKPAEAPAVKTEVAKVEKTESAERLEAVVVTAAPLPACGNKLVNQAEALNDRVKPVKELIGYIHSPQSLAMKVVNDHIVTIPRWVGYALDPVGAIKNKAISEVKNHAKDALGLKGGNGADCNAAPAETTVAAPPEKAAEQI